MSEPGRKVPLLLWPFYAVWRVLTLILKLVGRFLCAIIGLALIAVGVTITFTVVGAPVGIALAVFGFLLLVRAIF